MKKMLIIVATVAMAVAACGKKKDTNMAKPADGSATAPAGSDAGSGSADAGSAAAPTP